ncbi:MAG: pyridoxamine 5'-phosphate oxidase family protein [Candidatus Limnocylindrales bacterium]
MAQRGRELLFRSGSGEGLFTTIAGAGLPRTHPVNVGIVDGRLLVFVQGGSAKARDLVADGRYALHAHQDPAVPHEFLLRGRATLVTDKARRARAAASWPFTPGDDYPLFELRIEHALFGERGDADAWPPIYTSWHADRSRGAM